MIEHSKSQPKEKKPWEREIVNIFVILAGLFFLSIQPIVFIPYYGYLLILFGLPILLITVGILTFRTFFKYRSAMKEKGDRIGFYIIGSGSIIMGIIAVITSINMLKTGFIVILDPSELDLGVFPILFAFVSSFFSGLAFVINAVLILHKNYRSLITRLLFLSFTSLSLAWFFHLYYYWNLLASWGQRSSDSLISWAQATQLTYINYLIFYIFFYCGFLLMLYACQRLIFPQITQFHRILYSLFGISFFCSIFLILIFQEVGLAHNYLFGLTYLVSILLPLGYSVYILGSHPDWLTTERRRWITRIRIGILLLIPYPLVEMVVGLIPLFPIFYVPFSSNVIIPRFMPFLVVSISFTCYSTYIILSGSPDINTWFFEEIKFRVTPDLMEINPNVNLAAIWEQVDEWQKESELKPKEMTNQKLEEYVQAAKSLLLKEEGKPAIL